MAKLTTATAPPPLVVLVFLLMLCILGFYTIYYPHPSLSFSTLQYNFLSSSSNTTISTYLRDLTAHPHLAGTEPSLETINYVHSHFHRLNLQTHTVNYKALLSYPLQASLQLHFTNGSVVSLYLMEKGGFDNVVQPYHAYSPSGSVYEKAVFVNYGREEDYGVLEEIGVDVRGCVVIARRGKGVGRGDVVVIAEKRGAIGVLLYVEKEGGGVERGTVMKGIGDPISPGWGGVEGGETLEWEDNEVLKRFPKIPSLPLSLENALTILGTLEGAFIPHIWNDSSWVNGVRVGPGPTMVNLTYQGEKKLKTIQNVLAVIRGNEEPDRYVILGNHRDAWTFGAVDPNSGTAVLLDIARRYELLMRKGWRPRRTIIFCSWDAEEFGLVGSTEWVEENLVNLGAKAVAYVNVDCAVQGPGFFAGATPQLDNLLISVAKKIQDPDSKGTTLYDQWAPENELPNIQRLSAVDSDFAPFLQHAGIASIDMYYGKDFPVYHTAFDSYDWMIKHADPLFQRHVAVAGVWGLIGLHLADDLILPFNYVTYADQLKEHEAVLSKVLDDGISLDPLKTIIQELASAAKEAEDEAQTLRELVKRSDYVALRIRALNDRLMLAERGFLDADGLQGRQWFKHLIYGPTGDSESKLSFFPGISDAIARSTELSKSEGQALIQHELWRVVRAIQRVARALRGELT